jgi:predicted TIM-barrel fold metal-dependent hydrolase
MTQLEFFSSLHQNSEQSMQNQSETNCTRRAFCRAAAGLAVAGNLVRPAFAQEAEAEKPAGIYVDVHTHLGQTWNTTRELSAGNLLKWMDAHRINQAVVLPLVSPESSSYLLTSDFVLKQTAPHRDRLIPFCCIDPRTTYSAGKKGLTDMLRRYQERGAKGFGEHKPGVPIDDGRSMTLYEACGELKLPVLFHLDTRRNTDRPGLPGLERVLRAFPQTIFIGHGPGWWASISGDVKSLGGYPKGKVAPGGAIDRLMDKYDNLYGDLSAGSGANAISRDAEFGREFLIRRADRLMFGTDYLSPGQRVPQFQTLGRQDLPEATRAKIYRDNARKLLGLAGG